MASTLLQASLIGLSAAVVCSCHASGGPAWVPGSCTRQSGFADRALVATLTSTTGSDSAVVYTLESGGRVIDRGLSFGGFTAPQAVGIRSDGREALVAYGSIQSPPYGVVVLSLAPDGSAASLEENLVIGSGMNVLAFSYADDDHAVLAVGAGTAYNFVALARATNGSFAVGATSVISRPFPIQLQPRPGTNRALLVRSDLIDNDPNSELQTLGFGPGGWAKTGTSGIVTPPSIRAAVSPDGSRVYSPSPDPNDLASPTNFTPDGLLQRFHYQGDDLVADPTYVLPHYASLITASPDGKLLVAEDGILEDRGSGPSVYSYRLQTVSLDANGTPLSTTVTATPFDGLLIPGLVITSSGLLVTAVDLYPDQTPSPAQMYPLTAWRQLIPGDWEPACSTVYLPGQPQIAIAP